MAESIYNASLMNVQQCIEMLQQHDGNLPIQFYINKMPIANVDVSIDYQLPSLINTPACIAYLKTKGLIP